MHGRPRRPVAVGQWVEGVRLRPNNTCSDALLARACVVWSDERYKKSVDELKIFRFIITHSRPSSYTAVVIIAIVHHGGSPHQETT